MNKKPGFIVTVTAPQEEPLKTYEQIGAVDPNFESAFAKEIGPQVQTAWDELQRLACFADAILPDSP